MPSATMQIVPSHQRSRPLRAEERIARVEDELESLNMRLDALVEAVRLLAPAHYNAPWSENRLTSELHRARHR
jgi:hypothetical protein